MCIYESMFLCRLHIIAYQLLHTYLHASVHQTTYAAPFYEPPESNCWQMVMFPCRLSLKITCSFNQLINQPSNQSINQSVGRPVSQHSGHLPELYLKDSQKAESSRCINNNAHQGIIIHIWIESKIYLSSAVC